ncbi:uracil-DNA glycosylase [Corynebacterium lizhenjunii]|uniref:uracil-DNA glycosylase n=1 Tax=Corynebacterium lizhenjunii TaxID=2709394 RepID=UPI001F1CC625|nr:uracil-DNA glycosylase [Corynebacterium lizhenjunii]
MDSYFFDTVHPSWLPVLQPVYERVWPQISQAIGCDFLPPAPDLFRAFAQPQQDVRVLIVGQDPYPTPGHAMGLAFSTRPGVAPPRSLRNIYTELANDVGVSGREDGDVSAWSRQGVLLLNRVLSVAPHAAGSHVRAGWQELSDAAIASLNRPPLVGILWGKQAQQVAPLLDRVPIIASAHPSPLSARRGFFGSRPFSTANAYLVDQGAHPVDWRL